jgi:dimethylargininase
VSAHAGSAGVAASIPPLHRVAIVHEPPAALEQGERSFVGRDPIDMDRAHAQHAAYVELLRALGCEVTTLNVNAAFADGVFVEDTALVFDELAVLASPGAPSRRGEVAGIAAELRKHRDVVAAIKLPATLDGGDVFVAGRVVCVGRSARTNAEGAAALARILVPYGYVVRTVGLRDCLHLKSACCPLPDGRLLVNPRWADLRDLRGFDIVEVADGEPFAADVLVIGRSVVSMAAHPKTAALIGALGFDSRTLDLGEFAKAEGGVTCMSLVFLAMGGAGR